MTLKYWESRYETYVAQWPDLRREFRALPQQHKDDCARAMKWWVELGLVKEQA